MVKSSSMARVEIYRLKKGGSQDVIATCYLQENNNVVCEGETRLVERINQDGILDRSVRPPERIFPTHGRRFLEALKNHFNSGYLTASDLIEES